MCFADEPETRDAWWEEIRQEIKSHARALGCHAVVGYSESTSIWYVMLKYIEKCCTSILTLVRNTLLRMISLFVFVFSFSLISFCDFSPHHSEEVCILSASGTAAILNPRYMREGCLDIGCTDHRLVVFVFTSESQVVYMSVIACVRFMMAHLFGFCCFPGLRNRLHRAAASATSRTMNLTCRFLPSSRIVTTVDGRRYQIQFILFV